MLWSIFAYLFCASATNGCYYMEIDGYLAAQEPFVIVSMILHLATTPLSELCCDHTNSTTENHPPTQSPTHPSLYQQLNNVGSSTIGPFGYQQLGTDDNGFVCATYNDAQLDTLVDASWKTARAFAVMANICNGITMLFLICTSCVMYKPNALRIIAALAFCGSVCGMCVFSLFGSWVTNPPQNGRFHLGAGLGLIGALCSVVTGFMVLKIPPERKVKQAWQVASPKTTTTNNNNNQASSSNPAVTTGPYTRSGPVHFVPQSNSPVGKRNFTVPATQRGLAETAPPKPGFEVDPTQAFAPGTETVTETILPDGSKKTTTTVVGLDGSKTVTETIVKEEVS